MAHHLLDCYSALVFELQAYCDADCTSDALDKRSVSGNVLFLGGNPLSWSAKKQATVSRSSTEAEYQSLACTTAELYWVRQLLCDLYFLAIYSCPVL